jgi:hypothetical protein
MKTFPKHVRFDHTTQVKKLIVWQFAAKQARSGQCRLENARDRDRFKRRIEKTDHLQHDTLLLYIPRD